MSYHNELFEKYKKMISKKEVKKVKPYFEMEVVKVKKVEKRKEKCIHVGMAYAENKTGDSIECMNCGEYFVLEGKEQPKGNWVNGENLDKIKFPVPCSWNYLNPTMIHKGIISSNGQWYSLININKQDTTSVIGSDSSLKSLILDYNIHILKGKIIIYEEEK